MLLGSLLTELSSAEIIEVLLEIRELGIVV